MGRVLEFKDMPSIISYSSVVGKKESEGPLGEFFDIKLTDDRFGEKTWEQSESKMQKCAVSRALKRSSLSPGDVDMICAGDLLNQCISSSFGLREFNIPFMGLYGACSTMSEALIAACISIASGLADTAVAVTSSHFCSAERQFRFPLEYGGQRPQSAQWTVTGSGAAVLSNRNGDFPKVKRCMVGKITDFGVTDMSNMGAAMAPAAAVSLTEFFLTTNTCAKDYDLILTGDLGKTGSALLYELMDSEGIDIRQNHKDCGLMIFDLQTQDVHSGGSGCGCSASVLCGHILPLINKGRYRSILFCATGALMSTVSSQQGESIPGICHIVNIVKE